MGLSLIINREKKDYSWPNLTGGAQPGSHFLMKDLAYCQWFSRPLSRRENRVGSLKSLKDFIQ